MKYTDLLLLALIASLTIGLWTISSVLYDIDGTLTGILVKLPERQCPVGPPD